VTTLVVSAPLTTKVVTTYIHDLDAVFAWLAAQPDVQADRVAVTGFCFGGGMSLRYSLRNDQLAGTVVFYGSPVADANQLKSLPGPVLGVFGGADQSIPVSQVQAFEAALNEAGVPNKISIYEGQPHAFVRSVEEIRQGGPPAEAWNEMLTFLKETLQASPASSRDVTPSQATGSSISRRRKLAHQPGNRLRLIFLQKVAGLVQDVNALRRDFQITRELRRHSHIIQHRVLLAPDDHRRDV